MGETRWYVTTVACRNGIEYKTKFPVRHSERAETNKETRRREANRADKLARESAVTLGQELNDNYVCGRDVHLALGLSNKAYAKIVKLAGTSERDAVLLKLDNYVARQIVNKVLLPLCKEAGVAPVYHWISSDADADKRKKRPHIHMVCTAEVAELMKEAWRKKKMGSVIKEKKLYSHRHGDLQELADYLIAQTRPFPGKNRYHPSRSTSKPERSIPRPSMNGCADLKVPRGCMKIYRSESMAGRPQMIRYYRPPRDTGQGETRGGAR